MIELLPAGKKSRRSIVAGCIVTGALLATAAICVLYSFFLELHWIKIKRVTLSDKPGLRVVHFTDVHFKGDKRYFSKVVELINSVEADLVCFTGDLVEESQYLDDALRAMSKVNKPMYGIRGNHDLWEPYEVEKAEKCFGKTGGRWLRGNLFLPAHGVELVTGPGAGAREPVTADVMGQTRGERPDGCSTESRASERGTRKPKLERETLSSIHPAITDRLPSDNEFTLQKRILLVHSPDDLVQLGDVTFNLILAGHTHGGQLRMPWGSALVSSCISGYDLGLFQTQWGPLYVNPGIGTFEINARFCCRPEITIIEF